MLHVWTLWTRPWSGNEPALDLACLQLSVRLVASRGHDCLIHTDAYGAHIAARMRLPARVAITLDEPLRHLPPGKWAAGKVHTYGLMRQPFLHLDYDVFLESDLPVAGEGISLTVQHLENLPANERFYRQIALDYWRDTGSFPDHVGQAIASGRPWGYNCGIVAVHDLRGLEFLNGYAVAAMDAFMKMRITSRKNCAFAEQLVLQARAWGQAMPVRCLLPSEPAAHAREAARLGYRHLGGAKQTRRNESLRWVLDRLSLLT